MLTTPFPQGDLEEGRPGLDESAVSLADRARRAAVAGPGLMVSMCGEDAARMGRGSPCQQLPSVGAAGLWGGDYQPGLRLRSCC